MKKMTKRLTVFLLAALMVVSASGCYSENKLLAASKDDITLSIGGYVYYLNSAYYDAAAYVGTDQKVLNATIEDKSAEDWITEDVEDKVKLYFYMEEKFRDLGLELSEEDQEGVESYTAYYWETYGYGPTYEDMGISRESFESVVSRPSYLETAIFQAMYAPDGQFAISDEELEAYYEENYFTYEYFTADLTKTDEEGDTVDLTDDEKDDLKEMLEEYIEQINSDELTLSEASSNYDYVQVTEVASYSNPITVIDNASSDIELAVLDMEEGSEAVLVETDSYYYVVRRLIISDLTEEIMESESDRLSVLQNWKYEEFQEYVEEEYPKIEGITYNNSAINSYRISRLVGEENEMGTSEVYDETDDETVS